MANFLRGVREWATPTLKNSAFLERGVLTPEEFIAAGDQLVYRCPTWAWEGGDPAKRRPHLPADKQFLVTRGAPCRTRASALANAYVEDTEISDGAEAALDGEGWLATHIMMGDQLEGLDDDELETIGGGATAAQEIGDITDDIPGRDAAEEPPAAVAGATAGAGGSGAGAGGLDLAGAIVDDHYTGATAPAPAASPSNATTPAPVAPAPAAAAAAEEDEYEDMATFEEANIVEADPATLAPTAASGQAPLGGASAGYLVAEEPKDNVVQTRTYDISITYDKYYQTPRVWLFGFDEIGQPLSPEQTFEDIIQDYARRTVTIDPHPHLADPHASIHPCKHANVMKRIVDNLSKGGTEPRTDQYLFIFLKFLASVIPTVEYDFTTEVHATS